MLNKHIKSKTNCILYFTLHLDRNCYSRLPFCVNYWSLFIACREKHMPDTLSLKSLSLNFRGLLQCYRLNKHRCLSGNTCYNFQKQLEIGTWQWSKVKKDIHNEQLISFSLIYFYFSSLAGIRCTSLNLLLPPVPPSSTHRSSKFKHYCRDARYKLMHV